MSTLEPHIPSFPSFSQQMKAASKMSVGAFLCSVILIGLMIEPSSCCSEDITVTLTIGKFPKTNTVFIFVLSGFQLGVGTFPTGSRKCPLKVTFQISTGDIKASAVMRKIKTIFAIQ